MAADMYIHVIPAEPIEADRARIINGEVQIETYKGMVDEHVLAEFFANTLGSKWYGLGGRDDKKKEAAYWLIARTPSVRVGEVSWLKAGLLDNTEEFIPAPIQEISDIINEDLPVIDDQLIEKIERALQLENKTSYQLNDAKEIIEFLKSHKGLRCFTVSW